MAEGMCTMLRHFTLMACFACVCTCWADNLPSPFSIPADPVPGPAKSCMSCSGRNSTSRVVGSESPYIDAEGSLVLNIKIVDAGPLLDSWGFFTVHLGMQLSYFPRDYYAIIPPDSPQGMKNFLVVREGARKVLFPMTGDNDDELGRASYNFPGVFLKRMGDRFVVTDLNAEAELSYESFDAGASWQLVMIRRTDFSDIALRCEYSKTGELKAFILPGELKHALTFGKDGLVEGLSGPDGEITRFSWDEKGMMKGLRTTIPPTHPLYPKKPENFKLKRGEPFTIRDVHCECDDAGRLLSVVGTNGERYMAEYRYDKDVKAKTETFSTVETRPDSSQKFFEMVKSDDNLKTLKYGYLLPPEKKGAQKVKVVVKEETLQKIKGVYVPAAIAVNGIENKLDRTPKSIAPNAKTDALGNITTYSKNAQGRITSRAHPNGLIEDYEYDSAGRLLSRRDNAGRWTKFTYDQTGRILSIANSDGRATFYKYDLAGMPSEISDGNGGVSRYEWDSKRRLTAKVNPDGTKLEWTYKGSLSMPFSKALVSSPDAKEIFEFSYDPFGRLTKVAYQDGSFESWTYGCCEALEYRDISGAASKCAYDAANRKVQDISTKGEKTSYSYDFRDRLVRTVFPDKTVDEINYNPMDRIAWKSFRDGRKVSYEYDKAGRETKEIWQDGTFSDYRYDTTGRILSISGTHAPNIEYEYDGKGVLVELRDFGLPRGTPKALRYEYDECGRNVKTIGTDGSSTLFWNAKTGSLTDTVNMGVVTHYEYDAAGRRASISKIPESEFQNAKTQDEKDALYSKYLEERYSYRPDGKLYESRDAQGRLHQRCYYRYDGQNSKTLFTQSDSAAVLETYVRSLSDATSTDKIDIDSPELAQGDWKNVIEYINRKNK